MLTRLGLVLSLAGCAGGEPPRECVGTDAAWEERGDSEPFLVEYGGRGLLVLVGDGALRWDWVFDDLSSLPAGAAPFADVGDPGDVVAVIPSGPDDAPELLVVADHSVYEVADGDEDARRSEIRVDDGAEHRGLEVSAAWLVEGRLWVAYAEVIGNSGGLDVWSAGLGTLDADGTLTREVPDLLVEEGSYGWPETLHGGWDATAGGFWLTPSEAYGPVWFVSTAGEVSPEIVFPDGLFTLPRWLPLPDGRWTWPALEGVFAWDPTAPETYEAWAADALGPAFDGALAGALPGGAVVAAEHRWGQLTLQTWDGAEAGEPVFTSVDFDVCDRTEDDDWEMPLGR